MTDYTPRLKAKHVTATPYFDSLFDDFSIWQHADGEKPLPEHGYALDDAARGLIICLLLAKTMQAGTLFDYLVRSRKGSDFYGFFAANRKPLPTLASEDAKGQVVWAMGYAAECGFRPAAARQFVKSLTPSLLSLRTLRGQAYALLGALCLDQVLAHALQHAIVRSFVSATDDWFWPEDTLTYANGIVPYALLRYALMYHNQTSETLGRRILEFLEYCCTAGRLRGPIGYDGWFPRDATKPADNGQQAIDVAYMVLAWMCAYQLSGDHADLASAQHWGDWFEGENIAHTKMYEQGSLKAYDGIHLGRPTHHNAQGINYHSGAESNICFLLTLIVLDRRKTM